MTDAPKNPDAQPEQVQPALRVRTFLKGVVYYENRSVSIDCTIRDLSDTGARIVFSTLVTVPDTIELHIPQRQRTLPARVVRRGQYEIGVSFDDQRSGEPRRTNDGELAERVARLENEMAAMNRLVKQLRAKVLPNDGDLK
jgi:PilZ domain-containing protein